MYLLHGHVDEWTLKLKDYNFIEKQQERVWLDFAVKLLSYRAFAVFVPLSQCEPLIVQYVVDQLELSDRHALVERRGIHTERLRRKAILAHLKIETIDADGKNFLRAHLEADANNAALSREELDAVAQAWCKNKQLTLPNKKWMD